MRKKLPPPAEKLTPEQTAQEIHDRTAKQITPSNPDDKPFGSIDEEMLVEHHLSMKQLATTRKKEKQKEYRKSKKSQPSTADDTPVSIIDPYVHVWDEVFSFVKRARIPVKISKVMDDMLEYAKREGDFEKGIKPGWSMRGFTLEQGWGFDSFCDMVKRHEVLIYCYQEMKAMLGERREWGAASRLYDSGFISRTLGWYSSVFAEEQVRMAKLQAEAAKEAQELLPVPVITRYVRKEG